MTSVNPFQPPAAELEGPSAVSPSSTAVGSTARMVAELAATHPWVRFLSVMGFIGCGFMAIGALGMAGVGLFVKPEQGGTLVPMLGLSALYFLVSYKLHAYGEAILKAVAIRSALTVELALGRQRAFWKTVGVVAIVGMVGGMLFGIGIVIAAALGAAKGL